MTELDSADEMGGTAQEWLAPPSDSASSSSPWTRPTGADGRNQYAGGRQRRGVHHREAAPGRLPTRRPASANARTPATHSPPPRNVPPASTLPAPSAALLRADMTVTAERPTIPAAREETVELVALPSVSQPAPGHGLPRPAERASRPARNDSAAEVWALVERAQNGDGEAFAQIYDRYLNTVFRFIYFRVGSRHQAEDLTSETFVRALKRIGTFTWQGRDLGAWLVTIARHLVVDHFKSGRYRFEVSAGDVLDVDQAERGLEGSPEAAVVEHITNVTLLTAVKKLNPEQRECIVLRFLHGFSVAETARVMRKNEGAIKALQYRAVRSLHRLLPEGFRP